MVLPDLVADADLVPVAQVVWMRPGVVSKFVPGPVELEQKGEALFRDAGTCDEERGRQSAVLQPGGCLLQRALIEGSGLEVGRCRESPYGVVFVEAVTVDGDAEGGDHDLRKSVLASTIRTRSLSSR
jgi:hypothetical protein